MVLDRDLGTGRAECQRLLHGSRRLSSQRMVRHLLVCMLADILVAQGDYVEVTGTAGEFSGQTQITADAAAVSILTEDADAVAALDAFAAATGVTVEDVRAKTGCDFTVAV